MYLCKHCSPDWEWEWDRDCVVAFSLEEEVFKHFKGLIRERRKPSLVDISWAGFQQCEGEGGLLQWAKIDSNLMDSCSWITGLDGSWSYLYRKCE